MKISLWIYSGVVSGFILKTFNPLMETSGCLCGIWMLVRNWLLATLCLGSFLYLVSPADAPPSFPGTLSEIRVHERHTLVNSLNLERVK